MQFAQNALLATNALQSQQPLLPVLAQAQTSIPLGEPLLVPNAPPGIPVPIPTQTQSPVLLATMQSQGARLAPIAKQATIVLPQTSPR